MRRPFPRQLCSRWRAALLPRATRRPSSSPASALDAARDAGRAAGQRQAIPPVDIARLSSIERAELINAAAMHSLTVQAAEQASADAVEAAFLSPFTQATQHVGRELIDQIVGAQRRLDETAKS